MKISIANFEQPTIIKNIYSRTTSTLLITFKVLETEEFSQDLRIFMREKNSKLLRLIRI